MFSIAGPVIVYGISASVIYGLIPVSYTHLDVYKRQLLGCN